MQKTPGKPIYNVSFSAIKDKITYLPGDEKFTHISSRYDYILIYEPKKRESYINPGILKSIQRLKPFKKHLLGYLIQNFLHSKR